MVPDNLEKDKVEYIVYELSKMFMYKISSEEEYDIDNAPVDIFYYPPNNQELFSENFNMIMEENATFVKTL